MRDLIKMVVVLTVICSCSALMLSYANQATKEQREYQLLKYVKEPSIKAVLTKYDNDPIKDRITIDLGTDEKGKPVSKSVFPAKQGGQLKAMAYDAVTTGYNGPIEVMVVSWGPWPWRVMVLLRTRSPMWNPESMVMVSPSVVAGSSMASWIVS